MEIPAYIICKQPFSTDDPFEGQGGKVPETLNGQMNLLQCKKVVFKLTLKHNGKSQKCLGVLGHFLEQNE